LLSVYRDWGVVRKSDRDDNFNVESDDLSTYKFVRPGDLVLNKMKTWQGSLAVSAYEGIVSPAYFTLELAPSVYPRFVHYLLRSEPYIAKYAAASKGIRPNQWDLPYDEFRAIQVLLPPIEEQRTIADFLDDQVARIDAILSLRRSQMVALEDLSGNMVSEAFEISRVSWTRLGHVATVQSGVTVDAGRSADGGIPTPYMRVANVKAGSLDLAEVKEIRLSPADAERFRLRIGDVLMTEGGDLDKLGRGTVWRGEVTGAVHQNHVFAVRPRLDLLLPEYLALYTAASPARVYFETTGTRTTNLASTSASKVLDLPVPLPGIEIQREIVDCLVGSLAGIESTRSALTRSIDLLNEYKRSLTTAAVTGELDVTTARTGVPA
jgi:type I restriction enzyme S subunit